VKKAKELGFVIVKLSSKWGKDWLFSRKSAYFTGWWRSILWIM